MKLAVGTLALLGSASATMRGSNGAPLKVKENYDVERQLSGSGDMAVNLAYGAQMDDDGNGVNAARYSWFTSKDKSVDYSGMAIVPKQCMQQ
jgi:hypothetical protein